MHLSLSANARINERSAPSSRLGMECSTTQPDVTREASLSTPCAVVTSTSLLCVACTAAPGSASRSATRLPAYPQPRIKTDGKGKLLPA